MTRRTNALPWLVAIGGALWPGFALDDGNTNAADPPLNVHAAGFSGICQVPDQKTHNGYAFVHSDAAFGSRAAERFALPTAELVERVEWWGTYVVDGTFDPCEPSVDDFTLTVYADAAGAPGVAVSTNDLGASASRTPTGRVIPYVRMEYDEFHFAADLLEPFVAQAGATYWVEIVRSDVDACNWRWETAPPGTDGDRSAFWDYDGIGGYQEYDFDLALCLSGQPSTLCQGPDQRSHAGFAFVHSDTGFGSRAAERFVSPGVERLTRVAWWGTYVLPSELRECVPKTDDFTLTVYADAGGMLGEVLSTNEFAEGVIRFATGEVVVWFGIEFAEYSYAVQLSEPFTAEAGATYWVEIVRDAFELDGCTWWWETAPPGATGDGSALWDQGHGDGYESFNFDLAMCVQLWPDCNRNGIADDLDISDGDSSDCNGTAVPDECEAIGDCNGDGTVNLNDYVSWNACMTGPRAGPIAPSCEPFDIDTDKDADLMDFAGLQTLFGCP